MILRSAKIVVEPRREGDIVPTYRAYTESFARRQPGIVAVRLLRDLNMPNKFILHSWWATVADMEAAVTSAAYAEVLGEARADFLERMSVWVLDILDADERPLLPACRERVTSRILKVTLRPDSATDLIAEYHRVTETFTRRQPGCLRVQLFRDRRARNVFFVQSYWADAQAMLDALAAERLQAIRRDALGYLEERMTAWEMQIVVDDPHQPLFAAQ